MLHNRASIDFFLNATLSRCFETAFDMRPSLGHSGYQKVEIEEISCLKSGMYSL
jgi:hypothetical protein